MQSQTERMSQLAALSRLIRLPLSLMVALSALAGALAANPFLPYVRLWGLAWGIFFLSSACSVLNQVQERHTDALMRRTCRRPLACGALSPKAGTAVGLLLASGGLVVLLSVSGTAASLLGLGAMIWYLLVYTPLKRMTSFAVMAGTPCGALPPLIGWMAAGGDPLDPRPFCLVLIMLLWQVPHFWLLAVPDRDEFKQAGFKVLPENLSSQQLLNLSHFWILGLLTASLLLPVLNLISWPILQGLIALLALGFAVWGTRVQKTTLFIEKTAQKLRSGLHLYLGLVLGAVLANGLLQRFLI